MKTKEKQQEPTEEKPTVEYTNAFVLKGKELKPFSTDPDTAAKIAQEKNSLEKKFKNENELAEVILNNGKVLFGENTVLIDCSRKEGFQFSGGFEPDALLFVLGDKPKFYFIEIMLAEKTVSELFMKLTRLFSFFKKKENTYNFACTVSEAIHKNIGWRNKLKPVMGDKSILELVDEMLYRYTGILLMTNEPLEELEGLRETYTDTWGKHVKPMLLRKFAINGGTVVTIVPNFERLNSKAINGKEVIVKSTEEDHLRDVSETVKEIFLHIKDELQKADSQLEFRVKKHYISLRKNRNLAFLQPGKKRLSIVLANPEKNMQKQIKHHKTLNLAESVKKFWNGNEYCFTVIIESMEHLSEITHLLKKIIAGGEEKISDEIAPETPKTAHSEEKKAKTGKTNSQAKPKRKNGKKR